MVGDDSVGVGVAFVIVGWAVVEAVANRSHAGHIDLVCWFLAL